MTLTLGDHSNRAAVRLVSMTSHGASHLRCVGSAWTDLEPKRSLHQPLSCASDIAFGYAAADGPESGSMGTGPDLTLDQIRQVCRMERIAHLIARAAEAVKAQRAAGCPGAHPV